MKKYIVFLLAVFALLFAACKEKKPEVIVNADSLVIRLTVLNDSLDVSWKAMMANDDQKIKDISKFLTNFSSYKKYNKGLADSLKIENTILPSQRYHQDSISNAIIDHYDSLTTHLIEGLGILKDSTPDFESNKEIADLYAQIQKEENQSINDRIHYERFLNEYNMIIKEHAEFLKEKKPAFKLPKPKTGFSIVQQ